MLKRIDKAEADLILDFAVKKVTKEELVERYPEAITREYVTSCLQATLQEKDKLAVTCAMSLAYAFDFIDINLLPILEKLLVAGWHTRNEDIAHELQWLASPTSIAPLYYAITTDFGYRDDDELYTFKVQCVWALGAINTAESREKIKALLTSDIKRVRKESKHQMKMYSIV